jgi:CelD/BcsL family acetyltransferase involved in cellulose biosynthesis
MFRHVIDRDQVRCVDFLHGADPFKKDWMDTSNSLYGIQFPNPGSARGALLIAMNTASSWKENG